MSYVAEAVRRPTPPFRPGELRPGDFPYNDDLPASMALEDMDDDEQVLARVDPDYEPDLTADGMLVAVTQGDIDLKGQPSGEVLLDLPTAALQPGCALVVRGVMTDANGREERITQTGPLTPTDPGLKLETAGTSYEPAASRSSGRRRWWCSGWSRRRPTSP